MYLSYHCLSCQRVGYHLIKLCCQTFICKECLLLFCHEYQCLFCKKPLLGYISFLKNQEIKNLNQFRPNYYPDQNDLGVRMNQHNNMYPIQQNYCHPHPVMQSRKQNVISQINYAQSHQQVEQKNLSVHVNRLLMNYIDEGVFPKQCERNGEKKKINKFSNGNYFHEKRNNLIIPEEGLNLRRNTNIQKRSHSAYVPNRR